MLFVKADQWLFLTRKGVLKKCHLNYISFVIPISVSWTANGRRGFFWTALISLNTQLSPGASFRVSTLALITGEHTRSQNHTQTHIVHKLLLIILSSHSSFPKSFALPWMASFLLLLLPRKGHETPDLWVFEVHFSDFTNSPSAKYIINVCTFSH